MKFINRELKLPRDKNLFLFGARNTGKSTLLKKVFRSSTTYWIDLLLPELEEVYSRSPSQLIAEVKALPKNITHIVIDEIQKIPKLLDVVHSLIESTDKKFILTGSSARKLLHGGANLLAGRAFIYHLYPFTHSELGEKFILHEALSWGLLPSIFKMSNDNEKQLFLQAYSQTYLKEEIWMEQFIRKLDPFRRFLEVSAQCNGKIINFANIARDVGVDDKTIKQYFSILEDTLIGFMLEPFHSSFRKRLSQKPKFYYFDPGVARALARTLSATLHESTSAYGEAFEHFIILEIMKLSHYHHNEYRFSYLKTKDDAEVDLIVERPGKPHLFIEIKSAKNITSETISRFRKIVDDYQECEAICISRDPIRKQYGNIMVYPWREAMETFFIS